MYPTHADCPITRAPTAASSRPTAYQESLVPASWGQRPTSPCWVGVPRSALLYSEPYNWQQAGPTNQRNAKKKCKESDYGIECDCAATVGWLRLLTKRELQAAAGWLRLCE